jgi:hypothetical protein
MALLYKAEVKISSCHELAVLGIFQFVFVYIGYHGECMCLEYLQIWKDRFMVRLNALEERRDDESEVRIPRCF